MVKWRQVKPQEKSAEFLFLEISGRKKQEEQKLPLNAILEFNFFMIYFLYLERFPFSKKRISASDQVLLFHFIYFP